jgi:CheY-like chemotaxis protein/anti-sigma regulatory factor (Ser/Thr protein kinase)
MTRVLVVDDCAVDRTLAGEILKRDTGFAVEFARDGEEGLEKIAQSPPDLVLTDLQMPGVDGLELVSAVRQRHPRVPVILMTSQGSEEIAFRALQVGAASYVPKSLLPDNLRGTVDKVLQASIDESHYYKTMSCLTRSDRLFTLPNDTSFFTPLVVHLQDECMALNLCDESERIRMGVGLGEAFANAMYHGNLELCSSLRETDADGYHRMAQERRRQSPYQERHTEVEVRMSPEKAEFVIRDQGKGFNPASLPDPTDPANLDKITGRGILLMRSFMDEVFFNDKGNEVTMVKRCGGNGKAEK